MDLRNKRRALHDLSGGLGVVAGLARFYSIPTTFVLMFGIWVIGATLINLLAR